MNIKQQRLESLLQEILSEALSQLNDAQINTLSITGVKCSKGKQSAEVYIEGTDIPPQERKVILTRLHKAQGILKEYVLTCSTQKSFRRRLLGYMLCWVCVLVRVSIPAQTS